MLSEINASSQCLFPEMCGTHEMHPGEVNPPSIYQGPLVRVRDLSGAFCIFSNTTITLSCQASLWSAEGIPARLSTGWSRKHLQMHFAWEEYCSLRQLMQCVQHC